MKLYFDLSKLKKCSDQNLINSQAKLQQLLRITNAEIRRRKGK